MPQLGLESLGETELEALGELVHEQASQAASNAINAGGQIEYLLTYGWTTDYIRSRLDEMVPPGDRKNN